MGVIRENVRDAVDRAVTAELRAGRWWVAESYGVARSLAGGERFVQATGMPSKVRRPEGEYEPLLPPYEGLFIKFARLADNGGLDTDLDTDTNAAAALAWAESYGVLGLTLDGTALQGNPRGGPGDTVSAFAFEAHTARRVLRLYEAATREQGGVDVETVAGLAPKKYRGVVAASPAAAREWALDEVAGIVQARVTRNCYPQLYGRRYRTFVEGYGFTNLLGAMYLQAMWLLVAGDVRRCRACNRVITYETPQKPLGQKKGERKPSKTRKDKRFCGATCRQRYRRMRYRAGG